MPVNHQLNLFSFLSVITIYALFKIYFANILLHFIRTTFFNFPQNSFDIYDKMYMMNTISVPW